MREEVEKVLKDMYSGKFMGSDEILIFFFQQFWDILGDEVNSKVFGVLNNGDILEDLNYIFIVLIPKVKKPMNMKELRLLFCVMLFIS